MPKYRTETNADLIGAINDIDRRLSIIERTPQSLFTPGVSGLYKQEIQPKSPPDTTSTTTFVDLDDGSGGTGAMGPTVTVPITSTGQALVTITLFATLLGGNTMSVGFDISGATTRAADEIHSLRAGGSEDNFVGQSAAFLVSGLSLGANTFTLKYRSDSGTAVLVYYRSLIIQPA